MSQPINEHPMYSLAARNIALLQERDELRAKYDALGAEAVIDEWRLEVIEGKEWLVSAGDFYFELSDKPAIVKALKEQTRP